LNGLLLAVEGVAVVEEDGAVGLIGVIGSAVGVDNRGVGFTTGSTSLLAAAASDGEGIDSFNCSVAAGCCCLAGGVVGFSSSAGIEDACKDSAAASKAAVIG